MTDSSEPVALAARSVSLTYRTRAEPIAALRDLSLIVGDGEFVSLLGPSGCGKSTFLRLAAGLITPTSGRVLLDGALVTGPRREVGVVFQQPTLLPWRTVLDNVLMPCRVLRLNTEEATRRSHELLQLIGLSKFAKNYPHELSGGMQQRVALARALVHDPRVLLMDEPFSALDALTRERMAVELQRIWLTNRKSVLLITHSVPEAVFLSDRVIVLSQRPGTVIKEVDIRLPRPRSIEMLADDEFGRLCNHLREVVGHAMASD